MREYAFASCSKVTKGHEIVKKNRQIRESRESGESRVTCGRDSVVTVPTVVNIVRVMDINLCVIITLKL